MERRAQSAGHANDLKKQEIWIPDLQEEDRECVPLYLKALEIQGFKSFPDKTVLTFDHDVTAIVGPNGSGKSNISDAIRWVMGGAVHPRPPGRQNGRRHLWRNRQAQAAGVC